MRGRRPGGIAIADMQGEEFGKSQERPLLCRFDQRRQDRVFLDGDRQALMVCSRLAENDRPALSAACVVQKAISLSYV